MTFALCALIFGAPILWLQVEVTTAPEGWEDADGFHLGCRADAVSYTQHTNAGAA